jgi:hypothetical protein
METEIGYLGYSIPLNNLPPHFLQNIRSDLYVKPIENPNFNSTSTGFPVFRISNSPGVETYGKIEKYPQSYQESVNCARIQPDILDAFRKNPYTQSLHSSIFS